MSVTLSLLLALACAHRAPAPDEAPQAGLLGLRYQAVAEGLVVTDVVPGMGAVRAGIGPGDLVVKVAGAEPGPDPRGQLIGLPGTSVALTVRAPLGGPEREVKVVRGLPATRPPDPSTPDVVNDFERALERGSPEASEAAARALIAAKFGGWPPVRAIARAMRGAGATHPEAAAAAARVLAAGCPTDWDVQFIAAEALFRVDAYADAARGFATVEQIRPADVAGKDWRGDLGGDMLGRMFLARSLAAVHDTDQASATLRALAATRTISGPLADAGLTPPAHATETWRAQRAPLPPLSLPLLDGSIWRSSEHQNRPVLLSFWASWCGPCMEELPHLESLWQARKALGFDVLAISMDDPKDRPEVERTVKRLGLTFPVAQAPELADRFGVGPIPAARLIDRTGALRYSATGYSEDSLVRLNAQVDAALGEEVGQPSALGDAWAPDGVARLHAFLPVSGTSDVAADPGGLVLGVSGGVPLRLTSPDAPAASPAVAPGTGAADRVAWLDGAVTAERGKPWLRAWTPEGASRWFLTTPSAVSDLAVSDHQLWVATEAEILVLDTKGALLARQAGGADDLASGTGGVWAVDGKTRRWLTLNGSAVSAEDRGPAPDGASVGASGEVGNRTATSLVTGHFGPHGALRVVATREDGLVIGLDDQGVPRFTLDLNDPPHLAAWDPDGDGHDDLLIAVPNQGLAWVSLNLP